MNEEIKNIIERFQKIDPEVLKREGRDYEFTDVYPLIKTLYESIDIFSKHEEFLTELPENRRQDLINHLNSFAEILERISSFSPQVDNPQAQRDSLANEVKNIYNALYEKLVEPLRLFTIEARSSKSAVTNITKKAEDQFSEIQKLKKEIEGLLESSKKATARISLGVFSDVFEKQAKEYEKASKFWFKVSIGLIIITLGSLIYLAHETISGLQASQANIDSVKSIAIFLARLFPASIGYYLIYHSIKNYNVNMHLCTVNKHRGNILKAFESIVKPSDDPKVRDTILTQAAKAIFYSGDTGYLSKHGGIKEELDLVQVIIDNFKK